MGSSFQPDCNKIVVSLNDAFEKSDFKTVQSLINDAVSADSSITWDLISWLLSKLDDSSLMCFLEWEDFFKTNISQLSGYLSVKEFALVLLEGVASNTTLRALSLSVPFLKDCAVSFGLPDYVNTHSILASIQRKLHTLILEKNTFSSSKFIKSFNILIPNIANLFVSIFPKDVNKNDASLYTEDVLYYLSEALYLLEMNENTAPVFESFISVLQITGPGLCSKCYDIFYYSTVCSGTDILSHFTDHNMAFLHALGLCLTSRSLRSYWPTIFTEVYEFGLFVHIAAPFIQNVAKCFAEGSLVSKLDIKRLIRTQDHLLLLSSGIQRCLPTTWWTSFPISLITSFESISKCPISSKNLPVEVKNSVLAVESLLSSASITACCKLFSGVMDRSTNPFHCGLRAHMIVLFKNFLHDVLLKLQGASRHDLVLAETMIGESNVTLPSDSTYLRSICDLIFQYPLPNCSDSLFDQFGWLMAALNLAIYVKIRIKSITESKCGDEIKEITRDIESAFSRPDAQGRSLLKTKFIDPLTSDVVSLSNRYKLAEREYERNPDPAAIAPNAPTLQECQINLLRFRLLMDTICRVG